MLTAGSPDVVTGTNRLASISCPSGTHCLTVGYTESPSNPNITQGDVVSITRAKPHDSIGVSGTANLAGVFCLRSCLAVGGSLTSNEGVVVAVSGRGGGTPRLTPGSYVLEAIACVTSQRCVAAGGSLYIGVIVPVTNKKAGATQVVSGSEQLSDVACAGTGCLAVGFQGGFGGPTGVLVAVTPP